MEFQLPAREDRPYQTKLESEVYDRWSAGARNVCMVLSTGGGKTEVLARIVSKHPGASCTFAHRQELVSQLSAALAGKGLRHRLIASAATIRACVNEHLDLYGRSFYDPSARAAVSSVDTLVGREDLASWAAQVTLWVCDEAHHLVDGNKWHTAQAMFTNEACRGLGPTATPSRADGKGLGRGQGGVFDVMVEGPPMRWLIEQGYLTDYRIFCPPSDLQVLGEAGASGDWNSKQLREAAQRSHIVGDVVAHYKRIAAGKLGITFATDVETAQEITRAYVLAGVRAETLTGKTDDGVRRNMLKAFKARKLDQIVAVDIISEGFDLPAIEVASFARPTQSLALYMQQFGRALRTMPGKERAIIIDHAGNTVRHLVPDRERDWTLNRREKRSKSGAGIGLRVCTNPECTQPFENFLVKCPYCATPIPAPAARGGPEMVSGDLYEVSSDVLSQMRGEVDKVDMPLDAFRFDAAARNVPPIGIMAQAKLHAYRQEAQAALRHVMGLWGWPRFHAGRHDRELQREFFLTFGINVMGAQALGTDDANTLRQRIEATL